MTDDRSLERAARSFIEPGPTQAPEAALERALLTIQTTRQERDLRILRRFSTMTTPARVAATVIIGVLAIGGAAFLLKSTAPDAAARPSASASPSAGPTASASPSAGPPASASPSAGPTVVDASGFAVPFQMSWDIPVRPTVKADVVDIFSGNAGMNVFKVDRAGKDPCHNNDLLAAPLTTSQQFMAWLATIPKVTVGAVTSASFGGQAALERTVTVGTLDGCFDSGELHSGIVSQYGAGGYFMTVGETERWVAMKVHGKLVAIAIWPAGDATLGGAATRALSTLQFTP
jgi:hypothetical protein